MTGKRDERQLIGIYKAKAKADLDEFYNALADEAETGFRQNKLRPAFRVIKRLKGKQDNDNVLTTPVARLYTALFVQLRRRSLNDGQNIMGRL